MIPQDVRDLDDILRRDFFGFAAQCFTHLHPGELPELGNHIDLVAEVMSRTKFGNARIIVNLPPRHLKSVLGSVALPAWHLGRTPSKKIICASYGTELTEKLARQFLSIVTSAWYKRVFPHMRLSRHALHDLTTTRGGARMSISVGGALTGQGADLIIIDDPIKADEATSDTLRKSVNQWFDNTPFTRLNDKRAGSIMLIMQRLHEDDLTGHLVTRDGWFNLSLPAIAPAKEHWVFDTPLGRKEFRRKPGEALHPEREPLETLEEIRSILGEYNFAGQYQQSPVPAEGGMVKRAWFQSYLSNERPDRFDVVVQSWDTANKTGDAHDYSVCTTWGKAGTRIYLLHVLRKKLDYPSLKRAVREQADHFQAAVVLIEDKGSGIQLIQELTREGMYAVTAYKPDPGTDKKMRLHAQTGMIENGLVYLPKEAEWREAYIHELTTFPAGKHDDQVDSTSQALHWIKLGEPAKPAITVYMEKVLANRGIYF